jgi:glutamate/tyrosine decarboxylase-like PLP-dependent enzyme
LDEATTARVEVLRRCCRAPLDYPDSATLQGYSEQVLDYVLRHHETLPDQPIGRYAGRTEMEARLREPPPEAPQPFDEVLRAFGDHVAPYACRTNHPRFLAFIPAAPNYVAALGEWLCAGTNFFAGVWLEAAGPAQVELVVLDWFAEFLGLPVGTQGVLTGGGSEANLTALVVARERLTDEQRGRAVLYLTEQRHWSVDRGAKVMGLRPEQLRPVPADERFQISVADLKAAISQDRRAGLHPWAVVANGGATNSGAVDPLDALADVCAAERLWLHVDAAYGWAAALTDEGRRDLDGIARADSVTLDPHKWLAQPYDAGCVLVRDGRHLVQTFALRPDYMQDVEPAGDEVNFADHGIALTRRFRALKVWLSLKVLGVAWYRQLVTRSCQLAELAQALLEREPVFEILSSRRLSTVCFRYVPSPSDPALDLDRLNLALIDALRATGRVFLSSTRMRGKVAIRVCFVNWRTTTADVEEVVSLMRQLGGELLGTFQ